MRKSSKTASGAGSVKKQIRKGPDGKEYTYWVGRVTVGTDPGTGKQIQRSFTAKTQKDALEKMKACLSEIQAGTYTAPVKITVSQWLDTWVTDYCEAVKLNTRCGYRTVINNHLKPAIGSIQLQQLQAPAVQKLYNNLVRKRDNPLSPKTVKNIHAVLRRSLQTALEIGYIPFNPCDRCKLPRIEKHEIHPLDENTLPLFLNAIEGHKYEALFKVYVFTGLRECELLGLPWSCVDFKNGTITIKQQIQRSRETGIWEAVATKNDKVRVLYPAPTVMEILKAERKRQTYNFKMNSAIWHNPLGLVFTHEDGRLISSRTLYKAYKKIVEDIGMPDLRVHDLRHTFATLSLLNGDDIKTVQTNLGHATSSFTLDVYGHCTTQMKTESAQRMETLINTVRSKKTG